ncbi:copper amine oxidase N-terminal domain-containing protein [Tepidibacter formicigenes]|jgi:hypothetical protein|uniref:Copper amine oxidase N-terminal domain-containing protein n=1 Tax=Tepidibacter formicigenes DSM 15518 TaxID=1123349 RepID=A0A1M6S373_9FIRM|nr:copper amine oxidase N-terminal domain-containing protein [Tepidibacter formicigenes]SHK39089.1 Copper amine oxidase N-terminal domain-containing protein [Tepidibacter formicigenes DSM 15518]
MKKRICVFLIFVLLFSLTITGYAENNEVKVQLNGEYISFDVNPQIINGTTFVPARTIIEKLGATVKYDESTRTVTAVKEDKTVTLQMDSKVAKIEEDGETVDITLTESPRIINGRTLVPVRFISEAFDTQVGWDSYERAVIIIDYNYLTGLLENTLKTNSPKFYEFLNNGYKQMNTGKIKYDLSLNFKSAPNPDSIDAYTTIGFLGAFDAGIDANMNAALNEESMFFDIDLSTKGMLKEFLNNEALGFKGLDNINIKILFNEEYMYLKSDVFSKVEDLKQFPVGDKWIRFKILDENMPNLKEIRDMIQNQNIKPIDAFIMGIENSNAVLDVNTFDNMITSVEVISYLFNNDHFKVKGISNNTKTYTLTLSSEDIFNLVNMSARLSGEDIENDPEFADLKENLKFNFNVDITIKDDYVTNENIDLNFDLNSPEDGQFELNLKGNVDISDINSSSIKIDIPSDSEVIDSEYLENYGL